MKNKEFALRRTATLVVLAMVVASCGGSGDGGTSLPGVDSSTPTAPAGSGDGDGSVGSDETTAPTGSGPECQPDTICETDLRLEESPISDEELEQIEIDGQTGYVTTESGAVLVVDLGSGTIISTFTFDSEALDVAAYDGEIWVLTEDGPGRLDPSSGALDNQGTLAQSGSAGHLAVNESGVWVVSNGTGEVTRFDRTSGDLIATITDYDNLFASGTPRIVATDQAVFAIDEYAGRVIEIDPSSNQIAHSYEDLGFESESDGSTTSILASGPASLTIADGSPWVISNLANDEGEFISGVGAVYRLDPGAGTSETLLDLVGDPLVEAGFVVVDTAIWYIETTSSELIRVDRETGLQHRLRSEGFYSGTDVVESGGIIWMTAGGSLFHVDEAAASAIVSP